MAVFLQTATFRDDKGETATVRFYVTADTQADATPLAQDIVDAIVPLTNASLDSAQGAYTRSPDAHAYGTDAEYERIEDKARMTFQTAVGSIHRYSIPAPKIGIFAADGETVNGANTDVATFTAAMIAAGCSRDGVAIDSFVGGLLGRGPFRRKFTIFTKNPALTGPGL